MIDRINIIHCYSSSPKNVVFLGGGGLVIIHDCVINQTEGNLSVEGAVIKTTNSLYVYFENNIFFVDVE